MSLKCDHLRAGLFQCMMLTEAPHCDILEELHLKCLVKWYV